MQTCSCNCGHLGLRTRRGRNGRRGGGRWCYQVGVVAYDLVPIAVAVAAAVEDRCERRDRASAFEQSSVAFVNPHAVRTATTTTSTTAAV